ncbi:Membrane-bound metallopeptidase [Gaiella occulta]|uniref:Membrane-bound metallopeptidase n=1 Tax=Gaiella occulta TaxID=1002870 RepID=A0A7M2YXS4_9ACTN|nr:M23 family metallopeptidase [Gaiella occulta]RDI74946.1 Membrane-bound metallopeptidase [Gaiella occulta]
MVRRVPLGAVFAAVLLLAAPAAGDPGSDKARIDGTIGELRARIDRAGHQAGVLTTQISEVTGKVRTLQEGVDAEQARLAALESRLAASRARLAQLEARIQEQNRRLAVLEREYAAALTSLEARVREIYTTETPDALSFAFGASSFSDLLDTVDLIDRIGRQDERIAATVKRTAQDLARTRAATERDRADVATETSAVAQRTEEQRAARDRLVASRDALMAAQREKRATLAAIQGDRAEFVAQVEVLQAQSAALAAKIVAAQAAAAQAASSSPGEQAPPPSTGSFVWPVSGTVTSGFGPRDGRTHEGIDIAVPSGTPVGAAASGTVIQAGWLGGYGILVVIDHGNGVSTAYAHNSGVAVTVGQRVTQGQVIAYAGSTGNSSGPHVHFEVRVGGSAVDPLGYL